MKKRRAIALVLGLLLVLGTLIPVFAGTPAEDAKLRFRKDGSFTILNFSDIQDDAVLSTLAKAFLRRAVKTIDPDLIVLTGDNIAGYDTPTKTLAFAGIRQYMDIFEKLGVPVAIVFGNHDDDDTKATKEEEMALYMSYKVNVSYDEGDALYGCGTYNVPILASDGDDVKFNLYMIDSGSYDTEMGGYDYVHEDQIEWYRETSARLAEENGGKVPSLAFQHIVPPEIYDALEKTTPEDALCERGGVYYKLPETASPDSILGESPCPGTQNRGEFEAFVQGGDVLAVVFGHDHVNSFRIPYKGVDLVNTPTCGFNSYGNNESRGVRVIRLNEADTFSYETEVVRFEELMTEDSLTMTLYRIRNFFDRIGDFFDSIGDSIKRAFGA